MTQHVLARFIIPFPNVFEKMTHKLRAYEAVVQSFRFQKNFILTKFLWNNDCDTVPDDNSVQAICEYLGAIEGDTNRAVAECLRYFHQELSQAFISYRMPDLYQKNEIMNVVLNDEDIVLTVKRTQPQQETYEQLFIPNQEVLPI